MSSKIQVMLKTKVSRIGAEKDVISVKKGFAMNYLIPQGLAQRATKEDIARNADKEKIAEARAKEMDAKALAMRESMGTEPVVLKVKTTAKGGLYGKISTDDLSEAMTKKYKMEISADQITIAKPIKSVGKHIVTVKLSDHVKTEVTIEIESE